MTENMKMALIAKLKKNKNEESQKIKLDRDVTATNSRPILGCGAKLVT